MLGDTESRGICLSKLRFKSAGGVGAEEAGEDKDGFLVMEGKGRERKARKRGLRQMVKKSYPYRGTNISVEQSKSDINNLLRKYNVHGAQWTEIWTKNLIELKFPLTFTYEGKTKQVTATVRPPLFIDEHRTYDAIKGYQMVKLPDHKAAMRCLFNHIKTKLEAVTYGLTSIEEEFLGKIEIYLPDGSATTLGQVLAKRIVEGDLSQLALENRKEPRLVGNNKEAVRLEVASDGGESSLVD